jgi:UPF0755 protein
VKKMPVLLLILLALAITLFLAASWLIAGLNRPYMSSQEPKYFTVQKGQHAGDILERLASEGIVSQYFFLKMAYAFSIPRPKLKAGVYLFDRPVSPLEVLDKLKKGEGILLKVTLPEGLTIEESAKELGKVLGSEDKYLQIMKDPSLIRQIDPQAKDLEGYIFPDTYLFAPFTPEESVVKKIVGSFVEWWHKTAAEQAKKNSVRETVTLASIVEKESAFEPEKPKIAGVFINRLKLGMPLQSDPTVIYALTRRGFYTGSLLKNDLSFPDPFNTYVYKSIPPAPICSPGKTSILSVLRPEQHRYLYFVAKGNGSGEHQFSVSLDEHNKAVARYREYGRPQK